MQGVPGRLQVERPRVGSGGHGSVKPWVPGRPGHQVVRELLQPSPPPTVVASREGRAGPGGPVIIFRPPWSHPSRRLCLKSSNMEALEGPFSRAPGGPEEGTQAALQTKGVELGGPGGAGGPWGGEDGKGCWVTEGGTHGGTRRAPSGRAGGGERLAATATSHQALSYVP